MTSPNKYSPHAGRNKGYSERGFQSWRATEHPDRVIIPPSERAFSEKDRRKGVITQLKRQNAWTPGNLGINKAKEELHALFGGRK